MTILLLAVYFIIAGVFYHKMTEKIDIHIEEDPEATEKDKPAVLFMLAIIAILWPILVLLVIAVLILALLFGTKR